MEMAKVTSKGQITIPVSIRRRLNINEGDKLLFIDSLDGVMMVNPDMLPAGQATEVTESGTRNPESNSAEVTDSYLSSDMPAESVSPGDIAATANAAPQGADTVEPEEVVPDEPKPSTEALKTDAAIPDEAKPPAESPIPSEEAKKPAPQAHGFDLNTLLDEIRSIGSKI
jgi:AbrB family looped-hinge helix DNA binding protein